MHNRLIESKLQHRIESRTSISFKTTSRNPNDHINSNCTASQMQSIVYHTIPCIKFPSLWLRTSELVDEIFLVLCVGFSQLSGLLDLAKDVGQNHGGIFGRLADIAHLLAAEGIAVSRLRVGQSVGNPFFRVGQNRPNIVIGLRVSLNIVEQARQCRRRCGCRVRWWNECIHNDGSGKKAQEKGNGEFHGRSSKESVGRFLL